MAKSGTGTVHPEEDEDIELVDLMGPSIGPDVVKDLLRLAEQQLNMSDVESEVWKFLPYDEEGRVPRLGMDTVREFKCSLEKAEADLAKAKEILPEEVGCVVSTQCGRWASSKRNCDLNTKHNSRREDRT